MATMTGPFTQAPETLYGQLFGAGIHEASCSIWDTPTDSSTEALIAGGCQREEVAHYLSEMRPLYDAAKRCLAQLSGFLLLLQTARLDRGREGLLLASSSDQLKECGKRLEAVGVPAGADGHHGAMSALLLDLETVASLLDRAADLIDPASSNLDTAMKALFASHRRLLALSVPEAGLAPVDFSAACCNCRPEQKRSAA